MNLFSLGCFLVSTAWNKTSTQPYKSCQAHYCTSRDKPAVSGKENLKEGKHQMKTGYITWRMVL